MSQQPLHYQQIRFSNTKQADFFTTLRKRVNGYFKENSRSQYANSAMLFKTTFMISLYLAPFGIILSGIIESYWLQFPLWVLMGLGYTGIGLSIMHDANHGAYSKYPFVNKYLGFIINILGASAYSWKVKHNVLHHTYTNIDHHDEDIDAGFILRFGPEQKRRKIHKFQHVYAWFFYGLLTLQWVSVSDFPSMIKYKKLGLTKSFNKPFWLLILKIILFKLTYLAVFVALPIYLLPFSWWQIVLCFVVMHYFSGLIVSCIFQLAHIIPETSFPIPDKEGKMENSWAAHQLKTTANFSPNNRLLGWYIGGLNYQVEHHLFPNICHVHYKKLSKIVKATALEHDLPYYSHKTFFSAIRGHAKLLHRLGKFD